MAILRDYLLQLQVLWGRLSLLQRVVIGLVTGLAIGLLAFFSITSQATDYSNAYTNLSQQDAGQITTYLTSQKIPYKLANNGGTIQVPTAQVDQVRLDLASQNLPAGGQVGYEIFDKGGLAAFGQTDFTQQLDFQRALEGELARTIGQFTQIAQVRVHLVIPAPTLFTAQQQDPTAAIMVQLRPGMDLSPDQVRGIMNLVSHSVQGLKPENVVVVDVQGRVLSDTVSLASAANQSTSQLQFQQMIEANLQRNILSMLNTVIGPNKAVVQVSADLNWDQVQQDNTIFDPPQTVPAAQPNVVRSQQSTTQSFNGPASGIPGGAPGAPSNVVPSLQSAAGTVNNGQPVQYNQTTTTSNYEVSQTVEKVVQAPGAIKQLNVAVMLNGPMDPTVVQAIERTVATAAGIQPNRGDVVTVAALPFDQTYFDQQRQQMDQAAQLEFYYNMAKVVGAIVIAFLLLFFLRRMLLRQSQAEGVYLEGEAGGMAELEAGPIGVEEIAPIIEVEAIGPPLEVPEVVSPEEERIREMEERLHEMQERRRLFEEQVFNLARNNPEAVAQLIKDWVEEADEG